jgi:hypothetical protein
MKYLDIQRHGKMLKATGSFSLLGNAFVIAFCVLPEVLLLALYFSPIPHPLSIYCITMMASPAIFITASGGWSAYAAIFRDQAASFSTGTFAKAGAAFVVGFVLQNLANLAIAHHAEWGIWRTSVWKLPGNLFFEIVNPMMETFFWRVFLHREMAVRFFPAKSSPEDELLVLSGGPPILPQLSKLGIWFNGLAFGLYHYVPLVIFDLPVYAPVGITYWMMIRFVVYLCLFGMLAIYIREHKNGGILAALMLHCGIDAEDILVFTVIMDTRRHSKLSLLGYKHAYRHAWAP